MYTYVCILSFYVKYIYDTHTDISKMLTNFISLTYFLYYRYAVYICVYVFMYESFVVGVYNFQNISFIYIKLKKAITFAFFSSLSAATKNKGKL